MSPCCSSPLQLAEATHWAKPVMDLDPIPEKSDCQEAPRGGERDTALPELALVASSVSLGHQTRWQRRGLVVWLTSP